ncbi:MAG: sugar O-acetyltransferase [Agathobacter sp.]|nr:sugar O-acetyltransferase [Agathobacter sp.]
MTEKEKMEAKMWYDANYDKELLEIRLKAEDLCFELNNTRPSEAEKRTEILKELLPQMEENCVVLSPVYADYGVYTKIGHDTFINHNAYLMDGGGITIGSHCFIGPNCGMYTAIHATVAEERNQGLEKALPIVIGDNCWLGGDVTILPGVTIGNNTIIGAGSVVTKDIPDHVVAVGNPCRVLREITEVDRIFMDKGNIQNNF